MLQPVTYELIEPAEIDRDSLPSTISRVLDNELAGFILRSSAGFDDVIRVAKETGLEGDTKLSAPFRYKVDISELSGLADRGERPVGEDWSSYGITPLHADGETGDRMLSVSRVLLGNYEVRVFERNPAIDEIEPVELWDKLDEQNANIMLDGTVDDSVLVPKATILAVQSGDTIVFNPSNPHMGVTISAPRSSESTFFRAW